MKSTQIILNNQHIYLINQHKSKQNKSNKQKKRINENQ